MKHILILICLLLVAPSLVSSYNPSNEELRSSIFDYISNQSQQEQYQGILDTQNSSNQQLFNNYNQYTNNLSRELDLKLKELELQREAEERAQLWEKEKQIIDQQLELIRQMNELEAQRKTFEIEKNSEDLIEYMQGVADQIVKDRELNKSIDVTSAKKQSLDEIFGVSNSVTQEVSVPVQELTEESLPPKRNIFYRLWKSITSIF